MTDETKTEIKKLNDKFNRIELKMTELFYTIKDLEKEINEKYQASLEGYKTIQKNFNALRTELKDKK